MILRILRKNSVANSHSDFTVFHLTILFMLCHLQNRPKEALMKSRKRAAIAKRMSSTFACCPFFHDMYTLADQIIIQISVLACGNLPGEVLAHASFYHLVPLTFFLKINLL